MTPVAFKRSIRDLQVWCSSCMVAFSGSEPIGVLIGAKRPSGTLIHKIAVHPDHRRQGHGRHLLDSLGSKLAILGPPRITAEVPETLAPACELFRASGYLQEAVLTDYVLECDDPAVEHGGRPALSEHRNDARVEGPALSEHRNDARVEGPPMSEPRNGARVEGFVIPVTVDDLAANGLLEEAYSPGCWERSVETLTARKDDIAGLAVASDERIEAYILYLKCVDQDGTAEIASLGTFIEDGGAREQQLLSRLRVQGIGTFRFPKVHPAEIFKNSPEMLGFRPACGYRVYAGSARSD